MKKNLFAVAMALTLGAGAFSACSSEDIQTNQQVGKATSTMSVEIAMPINGTRASEDDYNKIGEWAGQDQISSIAIYVFNASGALEASPTYTTGQFSVTQSGAVASNANAALIKPLEAIRVTAGQKTVYVVVNPTAAATNLLSTASTLTAFEPLYQGVLTATEENFKTAPSGDVKNNADELATVVGSGASAKDNIVMTAVAPGTIDVEDNVTANESLTAGKNRVNLNVTRTVARVMVTSDKAEYEILGDNPETVDNIETDHVIAKVSNIKYVVGQGERALYVQAKSDFATPAYAYTTTYDPADVSVGAGSPSAVALQNYDYRGLWKQQSTTTISGLDVPTNSLYNKLNATNLTNVTGSLAAGLSGEFIIPNVHQYGATAATTGYRKGNTAYILVRALLTPSLVYMEDGTKITGEQYFTNKGGAADFVMGANGRFYENNNAAHAADNGVAGQKTQLFKKGKVLYFAWVNPDNVSTAGDDEEGNRYSATGKGWLNSPVVRNNIYHVEIAGFLRVGANWNPLVPQTPDDRPNLTPEDPDYPLDPTDPNYGDPVPNPNNGSDKPNPNQPNNPDPKPTPIENPNEPTTPPVDPKDPLTTQETWMSVQTTILPWKIHSYKVNLTF